MKMQIPKCVTRTSPENPQVLEMNQTKIQKNRTYNRPETLARSKQITRILTTMNASQENRVFGGSPKAPARLGGGGVRSVKCWWMVMVLFAAASASTAWSEQAGTVGIKSSRTDKVLYRPGEKAGAQVVVQNSGKETAQVTFECSISTVNAEGNLSPSPLCSYPVTLPPASEKTMPVTWTAGSEEGANFLDTKLLFQGREVSKTRVYFSVASDCVRAREVSEVGIKYVWPEKLFYRLGEKACGEVVVRNSTTSAAQITLECLIEHDLESALMLYHERLVIPPKSEKKVPLTWIAGPAEGGYALAARVLADKRNLDEAREYFAAGRNFAYVGQTSGSPVGSGDDDQIRRLTDIFVPSLRVSYVNSCLRFAWEPCDFSELTPSEPEWTSGQGRYHETARGNIALVQACHTNGISVYTYAKVWCDGQVGFETARQHPEWAGWDEKGHMLSDFKALDLGPGKSYGQDRGDQYVTMNYNQRAGMEYQMNEIIASAKQFGWDGVFFDSTFSPMGTHDCAGQRYDDGNLLDVFTVRNTHYAKNYLWRAIPDFGISYNFYNGVRNAWLMGEFREAAAGGAFLLYEEANSLSVENAPGWSYWRYFAKSIGHAARETHAAGGELYVGYMAVGCAPYSRHAASIVLASGAHMATNIHEGSPRTEYREIFRLATRYAHLLYGQDLHGLPRYSYQAQVTSDREVWWEDYFYERSMPNGGRDLIMHLVNSPATEKSSKWKQPEPPVAKNTQISIALPPGMKLAKCWVLLPDEPLQRPLKARVEGGRMEVTVAELPYYAIVVFRLQSSAKS